MYGFTRHIARAMPAATTARPTSSAPPVRRMISVRSGGASKYPRPRRQHVVWIEPFFRRRKALPDVRAIVLLPLGARENRRMGRIDLAAYRAHPGHERPIGGAWGRRPALEPQREGQGAGGDLVERLHKPRG